MVWSFSRVIEKNFCLLSLGVGILPFLPSLMEYLLNVLKNSPLFKPKELAISAIGAAGELTTC